MQNPPRSLRAVAAVLVLGGALFLVAGCTPAPSSTDTSRAKNTAAEPAAPATSPSDCACCCDQEGGTTAQDPPAPPVELKVVKFDRWQAAVRAQRGKVVVVDVWASNCGPCRKEFPHLVELSRRHADDGVVFMSVSVDPVENKAAALAFLRKQNPPFANYLLDEDHHLWQDKWDVNGLPGVLVFDRTGEQVRKFDNDDPVRPFTTADVEKLLQELLRPAG